jgi:hypothetical protein
MRRRILRRLTGDQRLALAVILQAIEDVHNPDVNLATRREATDFLQSERSTAWWRVVGLDRRRQQAAAKV